MAENHRFNGLVKGSEVYLNDLNTGLSSFLKANEMSVVQSATNYKNTIKYSSSEISNNLYINTSNVSSLKIEKRQTTEQSIMDTSSLRLTDTSGNVALLTTQSLTFNGVAVGGGGGNVDLSNYLTTSQVEASLALYAPLVHPEFRGDVKFSDVGGASFNMLLQHINRVPTFTTDNNGALPFRFIGQLQNYVNNAYENVLTSSSLSSYATTTSVSAVASDLSTLASSLSNYVTNTSLGTTLAGYASKTVANTFTELQTFTSGLTSTGVITANGGITATGQPITCGELSCTTETASGLITANGGLTVPVNQTLTCSGTLTGNTITASGLITTNGGLTVPSGQTLDISGANVLGLGTNLTGLNVHTIINSTTPTLIVPASFGLFMSYRFQQAGSASFRIKLANTTSPVYYSFLNPVGNTVTLTFEAGNNTNLSFVNGNGTNTANGTLTITSNKLVQAVQCHYNIIHWQ